MRVQGERGEGEDLHRVALRNRGRVRERSGSSRGKTWFGAEGGWLVFFPRGRQVEEGRKLTSAQT